MNRVLEKKIRRALNETIGTFVELRKDSVNLALGSGKATLGPDLHCRTDAFDKFGLPVVVKAGYVQGIDITIPTLHLKTKPLIVVVKKVFVTISPNPDANTKRARLLAHDRQWESAGDEDADSESDPGSKTAKIVAKLMDNMHIILEDVHIRLEDPGTSSGHPFAMGVVMDRFDMGACVVEGTVWQQRCVKEILRYLNKTFVIGVKDALPGATGFGVYYHPNQQPMAVPGSSEWRAEMLEYIMRPARSVPWVLGPIRCEAKLSLDKQAHLPGCESRTGKRSVGATRELSVYIQQMPLSIHHPFLRSLYGLVFFYGNVERWQLLRQFRPSVSIFGFARQWWQYAVKSMLSDMHRTQLKYEAVRRAVSQGTEYAGLFLRKAGKGRPWLAPLGRLDLERLQALEDMFPVDVTKAFRVRAWRTLMEQDRKKDHKSSEAREVKAALMAMSANQWSDDRSKDFEVEFAGSVAVDFDPKKKRGKDSWCVVVELKARMDNTLKSGWVERKKKSAASFER
jgi:vacuolar protein sorting-associated protein 13A/C